MISIIIATIYEMLYGKLTESPGYMFMLCAMIEIFFVYPLAVVGWMLYKAFKNWRNK